MSRSSTVDARLAGERLDDRQQRVRRERGRLVRVRVDELHRLPEFAIHGAGTAILGRDGVRPARPASAPRQGPRRRALRRAARRRRHGPGGGLCAARTSPASSGARSATRRTCTCSRAGSSAPRRCCATPTARSPTSASRRACRASARSPRASRACSGSRPTAYRAAVPARRPHRRVVPGLRACAPTGARNDSTFREDSAAARRLACWSHGSSIATTQLWVHDQDEALAFYTEKLGLEVRSDVTMPEMGNFRWLTVGPAGQEDFADRPDGDPRRAGVRRGDRRARSAT